jgi:hypothetical protein
MLLAFFVPILSRPFIQVACVKCNNEKFFFNFFDLLMPKNERKNHRRKTVKESNGVELFVLRARVLRTPLKNGVSACAVSNECNLIVITFVIDITSSKNNFLLHSQMCRT